MGNPVELDITSGQDADITQAEPLLENINLGAFFADKAYDADRLTQRGITPVIPPMMSHNLAVSSEFMMR